MKVGETLDMRRRWLMRLFAVIGLTGLLQLLVVICYLGYQQAGLTSQQLSLVDEHRMTALETRVDNIEWLLKAVVVAVLGQYFTTGFGMMLSKRRREG
jgi:hypothetical protein